eukprot:6481645-Amphidinium_carterae.1
MSMTSIHRRSEPDALVQSLTQTCCSDDGVSSIFNTFGGSVARQYTNLAHILSPSWGEHNLSTSKILNKKVKKVEGQLRSYLLLNIEEHTRFEEVKKLSAEYFPSTYVFQQAQGSQRQPTMKIQRDKKAR